MDRVAVLGAGSWGTALAVQLSHRGIDTCLWGRDAAHIDVLRAERRNARYLPSAAFPASLSVDSDLERALDARNQIIVAVPSAAFRTTVERVRQSANMKAGIIWATKGFELDSGKLPFEIATEVLGARRLAVISGPTFAREVAAGLPTAVVVASRELRYAAEIAQLIASSTLRAYTQSDMVGVEVGGAVKNVIAIGTGIAEGIGFGANARIALITRGLAEMMRLGLKLNAVRDTFMGLSGLGDLVLTCSDDQSRNRRFGIAVGCGDSVAQAQTNIGQVVEGVRAARAVCEVAGRVGVDMPICTEVFRILYESKPVRSAVQSLMTRTLRTEGD